MKGEDLREGNSPSWFNAVEAVQVIRYVQELRKFKERPVKLDDFGIITPYRKQVNTASYKRFCICFQVFLKPKRSDTVIVLYFCRLKKFVCCLTDWV